MNEFNFGENLRIIRQAKGISQEVMAIGLGISQSTYSKIERDPKVPDLDQVEKICRLLEVEPPVLLSGRKLEDLVPRFEFEQHAQEIMNTRIGVVFFWMLIIPFIDAAYAMGDGFGEGYGASDEVTRVVHFIAGLAAMVFAYYWMRRVQKGKK
jgi:transcriptional regulator with XRE-family HTH domain